MSALNNKTPQLSREEFLNRKTPTKASNNSTGPSSNPRWATGRGQQPPAPSQLPSWAAAPKKYDCFIGIDPGVKTGVAITDHTSGKLLDLNTLDFWSTTDLLLELFERHGLRMLVVIEDPNVHKSLYANKSGITGEARVRIGQGVGANKREASLLIQFCLRRGIAVEPTKPLGKLDKAYFETITGLKHGSQHARDAARLILGR